MAEIPATPELTMAEPRAESPAKPELSKPVDEAPCDLPLDVLRRILARLPTNEVPCTARLVCKAAAAALSGPTHTTVRLSQPSPHGEFARRWGALGAMRPLTLKRRRRLLCLTAASGCLHNLAWLAEHVGCFPDGPVLAAAAAAGRLDACRWLLQQGCTGLSAALWAAAGAGQQAALDALLADPGAPKLSYATRLDLMDRACLARCAARGGHVGPLYSERAFAERSNKLELLVVAAARCGLATLQQQHRFGLPSQQDRVSPDRLRRLVHCAAASSPTPDWKAKVEWVEACLGAPLDDTTACAGAAACPDALERLAWLRARGCQWDSQAVISAARAGNVAALSYLLAEGCEVHYSAALQAAAAGGHVAALEVLHSHGRAATNAGDWADTAAAAARGGQLPVVRWMLERQLIELQPLAPGQEQLSLLSEAAESGSIELLALLHAGGCRWGEGDLLAAARGGSEEALEWAVAQGCPVQESRNSDDDPYLVAARQGDWGTLACLRRLAVPWRPLDRRDGTFADAVRESCSVPILRRLLQLGCPVDWRRAADEAEYRDDNVRAWLTEMEQQRSVVEGVPQQQ